jgi:UDPglucose 6-dehydrogenase
MRVAVYGLWHLGSVTAACLAEAGHDVVGVEPDEGVIRDLDEGKPPVHEPGLSDLIAAGLRAGTLHFRSDLAALRGCDIVWVTFDTPVDDADRADVDWLRRRLNQALEHLTPGTLVLISSQVPARFTAALEKAWEGHGVRLAVSPENLRLGKALDCFRKPERIVVGCRTAEDRALLERLLTPFAANLVWMSVESAEMTKHAVNAYLAASVTFINELARICESVGADVKEVERGLRSEGRIGPRAYLAPGAAFAGGTLARDVRFLIDLADGQAVHAPLLRGIRESNGVHAGWARSCLAQSLRGIASPVVSVLGLTYKPGTSTLRRSQSVNLCSWLCDQGVHVRAHDPAAEELPDELMVCRCTDVEDTLRGTDVAVVATEWPEYRMLSADLFVRSMRRPQVIDANHFLSGTLTKDPHITYFAVGKCANQPKR